VTTKTIDALPGLETLGIGALAIVVVCVLVGILIVASAAFGHMMGRRRSALPAEVGPRGPAGEAGRAGDQGEPGLRGEEGQIGRDGRDGRDMVVPFVKVPKPSEDKA